METIVFLGEGSDEVLAEVELEDEEFAELERQAAERGISVEARVREILEEALEGLIEQEVSEEGSP